MKMSRKFGLSVIAAAAAMAGLSRFANAGAIAFQGFESSPADTWNYQEATNASTGNNGSVSTTSLSTDSPANARIDSGNASFQVTTTVDNVAQTATLTFDPVVVAGYQNVQINVPEAAISTSPNNGLDTSDTIQLFVSLNGAPFSSASDLELEGNSNARWGFSATGTATTTAGSGTGTSTSSKITSTSSNPFTVQAPAGGSIANGIANLYVNIPDGTTSVALEIAATDNSNNPTGTGTAEVWALDNIQLTGTLVPEPTSTGLLLVGAAGLLSRRRGRGNV